MHLGLRGKHSLFCIPDTQGLTLPMWSRVGQEREVVEGVEQRKSEMETVRSSEERDNSSQEQGICR